MATQFEIECAVMAGAAYFDNRAAINRFPVPEGWYLIDRKPVGESNGTGFEASAFGDQASIATSSKIVISFAGTDGLRTVDQFANFGLTLGTGAEQLNQAVDFYLDVLALNPDAEITFTGHSLGGGLAALMGVFFDKQAVTFDQAPFAASARWTLVGTDVATALRTYLADKTSLTGAMAVARDDLIADLTGYLTLRGTSLFAIPRAGRVTHYRVDGEVLGVFADNTKIGVISELDHGSYFGPIDLHSIALLSAFKLNDGFRSVTYKLTDLLAMVFDENLFAVEDLKLAKENLLERLIRHQIGNAPGVTTADQMLDRFTADLGMIAATPGFAASGNLTDALIAFAMQGYYSGPHAADANRQMLEAVSGGIHLDRGDIAGSLGDVKGYGRYFQNFLATLPETEKTLIDQKLAGLLDWYLAGNYLNATAGTQAAFMLGAGNTDNLTGGTQADLLVGLGGADILSGGQGNDTLVGGDGFDTYTYRLGDGNDRIIDSDKQGRIFVTSADGNTFLDTTALIQDKDNPNLWIGADGQVRMTHGGTWQLQIGGGRATKRHVCHIDASCERQYPASIPDPCAHGPSKSRNERNQAAAFPAAARIGTEIGTMQASKRGTFAKVSRGGTPGNEAWRQAA